MKNCTRKERIRLFSEKIDRQSAVLRQVFHRVKSRPFGVSDFEVKVVGRCSAGAADSCDNIPLLDPLSDFHIQSRAVRIQCPQLAGMVDHYDPSIALKTFFPVGGQFNYTVKGSVYKSPFRGNDIYPQVSPSAL